MLEGVRGEDSIAELCRHEGIAQGVYYKWSTSFMEAGKRRLATDFLCEGTAAFAKSWRDLMDRITSKIEVLMKGRQT